MPIVRLLSRLDRRGQHLSLRVLLLVPVAYAVAAVGLVGYLSYRSGQRALQSTAHAWIAEVGDRMEDRLSHSLGIAQQIVQMNADAVDAGLLDPADGDRLERHLIWQLQQFPSITTVMFGTPEGRLMGADRTRASETRRRAPLPNPDIVPEDRVADSYWMESAAADPQEIQIFRIDESGRPREQLVAFRQPLAPERPWYRAAIAAEGAAWSDLFVVGNETDWAISASQPAYDPESGELLGVFAANLQLDRLGAFLREALGGRPGEMAILDADGLLVADTSGRPATRLAGDDLARIGLGDRPGSVLAAAIAQAPEAWPRTDRQGSPCRFRLDGRRYCWQTFPLRDSVGLDWTVAIVVPAAEFSASLDDRARQIALLSGGLALLAAGLSALAARWVARPIARLGDGAKRLAAGDLTARVEATRFSSRDASRTDSIGQLERAFNDMAAQLQTAFDRLYTLNQALAASEDRWVQILEALPVGISVHQPDGRLTFLNNCGRDLLAADDLSVEERARVQAVLERCSTRVLHPPCERADCPQATPEDDGLPPPSGDLAAVSCPASEGRVTCIRELGSACPAADGSDLPASADLLRDDPPRLEEVEVSRGGTTLTLEVRSLPLYDERGEPAYLLVAFQDISQRKDADRLLADYNRSLEARVAERTAALQESESRLQLALESGGIACWELDLDRQRWISIGPDGPDGRTDRQELSLRAVLAVLWPGDRRSVRAAVAAAIARNEPFKLECRTRDPGGIPRWFLVQGRAILPQAPGEKADGPAATPRLFGTYLDISERRWAEEALRRSESRLQLALEAGRITCWERDAATGTLDAFGRLVGEGWLPPIGSLDLSGDGALLHPDDRERVERSTARWAERPGQFEIEYRASTDGRNWRWILLKGEGRPAPDAPPDRAADLPPARWVGVAIDISDRKQAELALRESEAVNRAILNALPDLIVRMRRDGTYLDVKPTAAFSTVEPIAALLQANVRDVLSPAAAAQRLACAERALATNAIQVYEFALDPNGGANGGTEAEGDFGGGFGGDFGGSFGGGFGGDFGGNGDRAAAVAPTAWREVRIVPLAPEEVLVVVRDISDRKQAERALQEREAMFRAIGDNLDRGCIYQSRRDPEGRFQFTYISKGIEQLQGVSAAAVLRNPELLYSQTLREDRVRAQALSDESARNLTPFAMQRRVRHARDGSLRWLQVRSMPRRLPDGSVIWDGVAVDITELKLAESQLRESEERFRRTFEDAPTAIALVEPNGRIVRVNRALCTMLGYTEDEPIGRNIESLSHPEDFPEEVVRIREMLAGDIASFQLEKRYRHKLGHYLWGLLSVSLVRDEAGKPLYLIGQAQDITERREVERLKTEFIATVSHELRTPLTSIHGALGLLAGGVYDRKPERAKDMIAIASTESDRLVRLLNDILDLSRLESGQYKPICERCRVADLLHRTADNLRAIAEESQIAIEIAPLPEPDGRPLEVWAAPDAVLQILTNLVGNALKFSPPGSAVTLSAEPDGDGVRFLTIDRGRGIPSDKLQSIFGRFQQVDASDSRQQSGTGLGLAICKALVEQQGGTIGATSRLGEGSTFFFTLPQPSAAAEESDLPGDRAAESAPPSAIAERR